MALKFKITSELSERAKDARREYARKYREKNRERLREYHANWQRNNADKVRKTQIEFWERKAAEYYGKDGENNGR